MKVICPDCGCEDIQSNDIVPATCDIVDFDEDGTPNFCGESEMDWDGQAPVYPETPYQCAGCQRGFTTTEIKALLKPDDYDPEDEDATV